MRIALFGLALSILSPLFGASEAVAGPGAKLADLGWLAGHWRGTLKNGATFETHYTGPEGGLIASVSKEVKKGRAVSFELEIFSEKDGNLIYQPHPNGKKSEHAFPLLAYDAAAKRAVFENKAHDYPQSFTFHLAAPDNLVITLSGPGKDGKPHDIRYDLKRVVAPQGK
jgi:hypothetical protein